MVRWYYYLNRPGKRSLCQHEHIGGDSVVARQTEGGKNTFAVFQSPAHLWNYIQTASHTSFYEVFKGGQKPYFDIDIEDLAVDGDALVRDVFLALKKVVSQEFEFAVYTSHTASKLSYHIVLADVYVCDHHKSRQLCAMVAESMGSPDKRFIDAGVYNTVQNFRLLGCRKQGLDNPKVFSRALSKGVGACPKDRQTSSAKALYMFQKSIVGFTAGCSHLSLPLTPIARTKPPVVKSISIDVYQPVITKALSILERRMPGHSLSVEYIKEGVRSTRLLIILKNNAGYDCFACGKHHDKENPFLDIKVGNTVYFNCRRSKSPHICGTIRGAGCGW